jgi:predicted nucleotidyltransferase
MLTMNLTRPHSAVAPSIEGDVLVALAGTTRPLTGREVAILVRRGSQRSVADALDRLTRQGLVHREHAGRAYLHSLNRDHLLAPVVEGLAGTSSNLVSRLRETLGSWSVPPAHASLFGSAARHEGGVESDIDLFIVRPHQIHSEDPAWAAQVSELADLVRAWTGNHASIAELGRDEVPEFRRAAPPVLDNLRRDGIDLAGIPLRKLLREEP